MIKALSGLLATWIWAGNCLLAQGPAFLRKDILIGHQPSLAGIGDFNGDGRLDVAINGVGGVSVALNVGAANFSKPFIAAADAGGQVVADFNGDGKLDLAGSNRAPRAEPGPARYSAHLLLGRGDGTFEAARAIRSEDQNACVDSTGDFNGDRKPDLVVSACTGNALSVWLGTGNGDFIRGWSFEEKPESGETITLNHAVAADFNRDGSTDLAVIRYSDFSEKDTILIFLGRGDGAFGAPSNAGEAGETAFVVTGDFNRDGRIDIATRSGIQSGNGDGTFRSPVPYAVPSDSLVSVWATADFNGDGLIDLAGALGFFWPYRALVIFPGRGDGTVAAPAEYGKLQSPLPAITADLDADGRPDLVTGSQLHNRISVLFYRASGGAPLRRAVSAASGGAVVAQESLATLYAPTLAVASEGAQPPWPTRLGNISLEVRDSSGAARFAGLLYVSQAQINFQVPAGTALGEATLTIVTEQGSSLAGTMQVDAVAPALFIVPTRLHPPRPAATAIRLMADGSQTPVRLYECFEGPLGVDCLFSGEVPLSEQSVYVSLYGTGFRNASSLQVRGLEDGMPVPILFAGPQATPGVDQINIRLTPELRGGFGLLITIDGVAANPVWLW